MKNRILAPDDTPNFVQELHSAHHKEAPFRENTPCLKQTARNACTLWSSAVRTVVRRASLDAENTGEPMTLAKDGVWLVPPERRPKGWQKLGLRDQHE
jgi:hypothetical protein